MIKRILCLSIPLFLSCFLQGQTIYSSLDFSIQKMENNNLLWGIYVKPTSGFDAPTKPLIATGQVTILLRNNGLDDIEHIQSINGNWNGAIEKIDGPMEAPAVSYYFIGFIDDGDGIELENEKETLLLTLQLNNCPDTIALINNATDPFAQLPNSESNNPGMDFEVYNISKSEIHNWGNNYETTAYSCGALSTSTNEASRLGLLKAYPNPTDQYLQLEWSGLSKATISILDVANQILLPPQSLLGSTNIDVRSFSSGMYFIKIESEGKEYYTKFVKR